MKTLSLSIMILFIGCASTPKEKKEKELGAITQKDFKVEKQVLYNSKADTLREIKSFGSIYTALHLACG